MNFWTCHRNHIGPQQGENYFGYFKVEFAKYFNPSRKKLKNVKGTV